MQIYVIQSGTIGDPTSPIPAWWTGSGWSAERPNAMEFPSYMSADVQLKMLFRSPTSNKNFVHMAEIIEEEKETIA